MKQQTLLSETGDDLYDKCPTAGTVVRFKSAALIIRHELLMQREEAKISTTLTMQQCLQLSTSPSVFQPVSNWHINKYTSVQKYYTSSLVDTILGNNFNHEISVSVFKNMGSGFSLHSNITVLVSNVDFS